MNQTIISRGYPRTLLKEFKYWVVLLRPTQITAGTLVLAIKSDVSNFGELSAEEWAEFAEVSAFSEHITAKVFGAEKYNYAAFMMKDPNPHFHFVPRYSRPVEVAGAKMTDIDWPLKTQMQVAEISDETFDAIMSELKGAL
ncbi:MAG TPA: HIT family protein [Candidatus Saccharimonadales bacterium]|nr:HIT family protein [Candidatus Saccharimonadales bacterium]